MMGKRLPFYLNEDEIALIQNLRKLTIHERGVITDAIHRTASQTPPIPMLGKIQSIHPPRRG